MIQFVLIGIAAAAAFLGTTWFRDISLFGLRPDIVLIVLTFLAHREGTRKGEISGFIVGIIEDALSISPFGFHALLRTAHSAIIGITRGAVHGESLVTSFVLLFGASIIRYATMAFIAVIFSLDHLYGGIFSLQTLGNIGMTAVVGVPLFALLHVLVGLLEKER